MTAPGRTGARAAGGRRNLTAGVGGDPAMRRTFNPDSRSLVLFIMDHPVTFAAQFARLVRLVEERADVVAQKAALRSCLAASKRGSVGLSIEGDVLLAGGAATRRDEDTDLLVARIEARRISSIVIEGGAAPG